MKCTLHKADYLGGVSYTRWTICEVYVTQGGLFVRCTLHKADYL